MANKLHKGLKPARKILRVTQTEIAKRMDCNASYLSTIERGIYSGSIALYEKICYALELPLLVVAMESYQAEGIDNKDIPEFMAIKEQLYRFLGVEQVEKQKMEYEEGRKLADKLWKAKQLKKSMASLADT